MSTVAQGHERQQGPVVLGGRIVTILDAKPLLDLGPPRMMEVDDAYQRSEYRQDSWACPVGWRWRDRHVVRPEGRRGVRNSACCRFRSPRRDCTRLCGVAVIQILP